MSFNCQKCQCFQCILEPRPLSENEIIGLIVKYGAKGEKGDKGDQGEKGEPYKRPAKKRKTEPKVEPKIGFEDLHDIKEEPENATEGV